MIRLEWLFFLQLVMGVVLVLLLQKITQMKKQIGEITREVMNYISFITEDMEKEEPKEISSIKKKDEEAQNRLIQAVLGEYFQ